MPPKILPRPNMIIRNVHLAYDAADDRRSLYNLVCAEGKVQAIELVEGGGDSDGIDAAVLDAEGYGILLPALCHAHIHLDKCFLLDKCDELVSGDFAEALCVTAKAKRTFPSDTLDLHDRGKRLIIESIQCGVTMMRAHVEIDATVHMSCLEVGLALREEFKDLCDVQIAAFAQDPLFASAIAEQPSENFTLLQQASRRAGVQAVGSAPYVEPTIAQAKQNIVLVLDMAYDHRLHADFHLDYNVDLDSEPLIWYLLNELRARKRAHRWHAEAHVCIGHATRLTLFTPEEWTKFRNLVHADDLPITLVGLPPSDMYMMGRQVSRPPRTTLNVPKLEREHGLHIGMSVNNIENAFTPQGPVDPLSLCTLGVAIFQSGTSRDCTSLIEAVTVTARRAIGSGSGDVPDGPGTESCTPLRPVKGDIADFVLLHGNNTVHSAALNPSYSRTTIKNGVVVARRRASNWMLPNAR